MRKLGKLKLTQLNRDELEARQMNALRGGDGWTCACGCEVASTAINRNANSYYGYTSTAGWTYGADGNDCCSCTGYTYDEAASVQIGASQYGRPL